MSLIAIQRDFCAELRDRPSDIQVRLAAGGARGLDVYRNAYRLRLRDCLRETYEKTWAWLGDARFDEAVNLYIKDCAPTSWTLADYGERFSETIATLAPDAAEAVELAALEWAMRRAFDGPGAAPLTTDQCEGIDWESVVLRLAPTFSLVPVTTNCGAIWAAISEGGDPPAATVLPATAALCVWRKALSPTFRTVEGLELIALNLALSGVAFGDMCRQIAERHGAADVIEPVGAMLARWLQDEMLVAPSGAQPARSLA